MAPTLVDRLRAVAAESRLFPEPGTAVLAVSGGADSTALLDLIWRLRQELGLAPLVAHADHGIRPDSARVAEQVSELARRRYGLECVTEPLHLGAGASETRARAARYRFLRRVQAARGARYLLTAHHADDQIETVLLRLLRGSAPAGLAGIPQRGPGGLVRPLLGFRRRELLDHVKAAGLPFHEDPANLDTRHVRSWVRACLLPLVGERLGEGGVHSLLRVAAFAREEVGAWDRVLDRLPGLVLDWREGRFAVARGVLGGYDNVLAARVLRAAARRSGMRLLPAAAARLAGFAAAGRSGGRLALGEGLEAEIAFDRLLVSRGQPEPEERTLNGGAGETRFGAFRLRWRAEAAPQVVPRGGWSTWIVPGELAVRPPRPGDRLAPLLGVGRRRVVRVLMEARVARRDRRGYPVLVRGAEVVWVPGICRAQAAVPAPGLPAVRVDVEPG
jgi:tRNA(Ile)-lysidine synthase